MSTTANGREIYVIGRQAWGNRSVVIQENGTVHDQPATAKYTYASTLTRMPYEL